MNKIVYLMCKYAGVPVRVLSVLGRVAPHGSPLRAIFSNVMRGASNNGLRKAFVSDLRGATPGFWKGPALASNAFNPYHEPAVFERGLQRYFSTAGNPAVTAKEAPSMVNRYVWRNLDNPGAVQRYRRLSGRPAELSKVIDQYRANAQGSDAVQYFFSQNARNPVQSSYFRNMRIVQDGAGEYIPREYRVIAGSPTRSGAFHTVGHELGHAKHYTQRAPQIVSQSVVSNYTPSNLPYMQRWGAKVGDQSTAALQFWREVAANKQYNQVMRKALADNPQLYARWRASMEGTNLPSLSTYLYYGNNELLPKMFSLPKSMMPQATNYFKQYYKLMERAQNYATRKQIPLNQAFEHTIDVYRRAAQRRDPTLGRDLYQYAVSKGMPVNPNAWYNQPEFRTPGRFIPDMNAAPVGELNPELATHARRAIAYWG